MLPMSTPILIVASILQVTGIWNDFIFGLTFAGRENLPMTVQLNNVVNSTQGERAYNVDMAATMLTAARPALRLLRLRALVRARHRRRCREGLTAMGAVSVRDVTVAFEAVRVFDRLSLEVERGEFLVLLGPSGCGKSTLLNAIAGLLEVETGQIWIGERNVTWEEPKDRGIAMVFQSYALYPRMSVRENLSFGLRMAKTPKPEIERRWRRPRPCCRSTTCSTAARTSSRAASASAWRSAGRWSATPPSSSSTSRSPTSTPSSGTSSGSRSSACTSASARPP